MIAIQAVLIVGFIIFLMKVLANPASYQLHAWTKILAVLFVVVAIVTVLFPDITNTLANWLGVSRGADLLLYILTLAFIFSIFSSYTHSKRVQKQIVLLARKAAILEANTLRDKSSRRGRKA